MKKLFNHETAFIASYGAILGGVISHYIEQFNDSLFFKIILWMILICTSILMISYFLKKITKKRIKLDKLDFKNYIISFFSGLMASLAIIFSLKSQEEIYNSLFFMWIFITFVAGLICVIIVHAGLNKK